MNLSTLDPYYQDQGHQSSYLVVNKLFYMYKLSLPIVLTIYKTWTYDSVLTRSQILYCFYRLNRDFVQLFQ